MDKRATEVVQGLMSELGVQFGTFKPHARYHHGMDYVLYLTEDVAYRADRVDQYLTLLLHPHETRPVGVKLKGFRWVFSLLEDAGIAKESQWLPLVDALQVVLERGAGEEIMDEAERKRKYALARAVIRQVGLAPDELADLAA